VVASALSCCATVVRDTSRTQPAMRCVIAVRGNNVPGNQSQPLVVPLPLLLGSICAACSNRPGLCASLQDGFGAGHPVVFRGPSPLLRPDISLGMIRLRVEQEQVLIAELNIKEGLSYEHYSGVEGSVAPMYMPRCRVLYLARESRGAHQIQNNIKKRKHNLSFHVSWP
jgi:hypothetical protein